MGALTVGETRISGLLEAQDVLNTAQAMRQFGAEIVRIAPGGWRVWGRGVGGWARPAAALDFGNSGTGARLAMGAYFPEDLLARLEDPVEEWAAELIGVMFPPRSSQLFLADRF